MRPRLLDLFCGAGGCSAGYYAAGWMPEGIDSNARALRRYPFLGWQADAMQLLRDPAYLDGYDAIHASPPCQVYSVTRHTHSNEHPDLLAPVLSALTAWGNRTGRPWVVENVPGAPMPPELTVTVCGAHLRAHDPATGGQVRLRRHRLFASNVPLLVPPCGCDSTVVAGAYGGGSTDYTHARTVRMGGYTPSLEVRQDLLGIDWMTQDQLSQAIPPDYTRMIGSMILEQV